MWTDHEIRIKLIYLKGVIYAMDIERNTAQYVLMWWKLKAI